MAMYNVKVKCDHRSNVQEFSMLCRLEIWVCGWKTATFTFDECEEAKKLGILSGKFCNEKRNCNQSSLNMSQLLFHRMS